MPADDAGGWTQITSKSKRRYKPKADHTAYSSSQASEPSTSPEELRKQYLAHRATFEQSLACATLRTIVASHAADAVSITSAVCLGIGSFDAPGQGWEIRRRAFVQLAAFLVMVEYLCEHISAPIPCLFQEPLFTASDVAFLGGLSPLYTVAQTPEGYDHVTPSTLLFGVHLYREVYSAAIAKTLPGIFVGTGWDVWETAANLDVKAELPTKLERLENLTNFYKWQFPRERMDMCFSDTTIYWRRQHPKAIDSSPTEHQNEATKEEH